MKKLLILGAGGYGKTILDVAEQLGCYEKIAFLEPEILETPENVREQYLAEELPDGTVTSERIILMGFMIKLNGKR